MLIFDKFPDFIAASLFAEQTRDRFKLRIFVCSSRQASDAIDPFPCELTPPIVLVERSEGDDLVIALARKFGAEFAGT